MQALGKSLAVHTDAAARTAALSSALAPIFRGKFCDTLLPGRATRGFDAEEVIYDLGDTSRTMFFIRQGVVKLGTTTDAGRDIIYDLRKGGEVVGELCAVEPVRRDRAVAVERTDAIPVTFAEVLDALAKHPALLRQIVEIFCSARAEAYDQVIGWRLTTSGIDYSMSSKRSRKSSGAPWESWSKSPPTSPRKRLRA